MSRLPRDDTGDTIQVVRLDYANIQNVSVSGTSAATTNGMPHGCTLALLVSTTNCWFRCATTPTAAKDNTSIYLAAGMYFYHPCAANDKFAFIQDSASGTAQVIPAL